MIELVNLTKIYHSDTDGSIALKDISIKFPEMGFVVVTGQSGSGKTTLLNVLSGFQTYEEGSMLIDGVDALTYRSEDWKEYQKSTIGFIFQDYCLIESYTVLSNIVVSLEILGLSAKDAKDRAMKYLKMVNLDDLANEKVITLSSGQKQRLSIARAFAKEPKLILCDEPTANLDPKNSVEIMKLLKEISKNCLVITSTHNYEDAKEYADYFVRLYNGNLVSFDEVNKISSKNTEKSTKDKTKIIDLYKTYLKEKTGRTVFTSLFVSIIFVAIFVLLSTFLFNIDDTRTKILNKNMFNNINPNELLIMKNDNSCFSYDELDDLLGVSHVIDYDYYSLASDYNYYYRENIDYGYELRVMVYGSKLDPIEVVEKHFVTLSDNLFVKSFKNKIDESSLVEGRLPESYNEVIANSSYNLGDMINVFFIDHATQGYNEFQYQFKVVGVANGIEDLYFSNEFTHQIDIMQYYSFEEVFNFKFYYQDNKHNDRSTSAKLVPIYNEELDDNEIVISNLFYASNSSFTDQFSHIIFENLVNSESITATIKKPLNLSENITQRFIFVGKNIYESYIKGYESSCARIYVDDYSRINDVSSILRRRGFNVISPYRAASIDYDPELVTQRNISLIVSLSLIVFISLVFYLFFYLFMNMKNKEIEVLSLQGLELKTLFKFNLIDSLVQSVAGILFGVIIYNLATIFAFSDYIKESGKYIRFYHYIIIVFIILLISFLSHILYSKKLSKKKQKGVI